MNDKERNELTETIANLREQLAKYKGELEKRVFVVCLKDGTIHRLIANECSMWSSDRMAALTMDGRVVAQLYDVNYWYEEVICPQ